MTATGVLGSDSRADAEEAAFEKRTIRKISLRLLPFLVICYFFAYLDRVNLGFAALTMNSELGFSSTVFSIGAGIFFIGYFLFEIPSNIALERFGASRWIARIMISWGVVSVLMALVVGTYSFYTMRFLLGVAEAGFFPGILLYLTFWFPAHYRARIVAGFVVAVPLSSTVGSPISGLLLGLDGLWGLRGWQWLFVIEGIPSILLGFVAFSFLTDRPESARWLDDRERTWLTSRLRAERLAKEAVRHLTFGQEVRNIDLWGLSLIYFGLVAALYGVSFWLPQIVKAFGLSNSATGFVVAVPYLFGALGMVVWAMSSDRRDERVWHVALPLLLAGLGLAASALAVHPAIVTVALILASIGIYCAFALFWTLPAAMLTGAAAAGGIALINSVGNLAGFGGPYLVGWIKDATGEFSTGLLVVAMMPACAAVLTLVLGKMKSRELATETGEPT